MTLNFFPPQIGNAFFLLNKQQREKNSTSTSIKFAVAKANAITSRVIINHI